ALLLVDDLVGPDGAGHLVISLGAGRGAQQVVEQYSLTLAEIPERHARTRVVAGGEVAPLRAGRVVRIRSPDESELIAAQAVEEGARGHRHLPAAARVGRDIPAGPRPGLGRGRARGRPGEAGRAEAERSQTDRACRAPTEETSSAGGAHNGSR